MPRDKRTKVRRTEGRELEPVPALRTVRSESRCCAYSGGWESPGSWDSGEGSDSGAAPLVSAAAVEDAVRYARAATTTQRLVQTGRDAVTLAALLRPSEFRMAAEDPRVVVADSDAASHAGEGHGECGGLRLGLWANLGRNMARNSRAVSLDRYGEARVCPSSP